MAKLFEGTRGAGEIFDGGGEGQEDIQIGQAVLLRVLEETLEGIGIEGIRNGGAGAELLLQAGERERGRVGGFSLYEALEFYDQGGVAGKKIGKRVFQIEFGAISE